MGMNGECVRTLCQLTRRSILCYPWCWHLENVVLCLKRRRLHLYTGEGPEDVVQHHSSLRLYSSFMGLFLLLFLFVFYISCDIAPGEASLFIFVFPRFVWTLNSLLQRQPVFRKQLTRYTEARTCRCLKGG